MASLCNDVGGETFRPMPADAVRLVLSFVRSRVFAWLEIKLDRTLVAVAQSDGFGSPIHRWIAQDGAPSEMPAPQPFNEISKRDRCVSRNRAEI